MKKNLKNPVSLNGKLSKSNALKIKWKQILFGLFMLTVLTSFSQNEATKWYFGQRAGLNFLTSPPSVIPTSTITTGEGCASIADAAGNTLFYTDGITVFNHNDDTLANGKNLFGDGSTTQSGIIVKQPGNSNIYYIFTQDDVGGPNGFCYSVVNMSLAAGLGSVTAKNILLQTPSCEKITAVRHCNGVDVWVVSHDYGTNGFRTYLVNAAGVNTTSPVVSNVGTVINNIVLTLGQMKISANGKKLGLAIYDPSTTTFAPYEIYDFDPATGMVSNQLVLFNTSDNYGCEFSPDGTKFYGASFGHYEIFQWDLCAGTSTAVVNSKYSISTGTVSPCQLQLAVNGKIYIAMLDGNLSIINSPNTAGAACNYSGSAVTYTSPNVASLGLPNFINSFFKTSPAPFTFTTNCQSVNFTAPPPQGTVASGCSFATNTVTSMVWNFGEPGSGASNTSTLTNPAHSFSTAGTYTVKLALNYACSSDTLRIPVTIASVSTLSLSGSFTVCPKDKRVYTASGASNYTWSTGQNTPTVALTTSATTVYTLTGVGTGTNSCKAIKIFTVVVSKCTGIEEESNDNIFKIYPNPGKGFFNVETDKTIKLVVSNSLGQIILEKTFDSGVYTVDLSNYGDGIYFVKSTSAKSSKIVRVVKTE